MSKSGEKLPEALADYLTIVQQHLRLDVNREKEILQELQANLQECIEGYRLENPALPEEEVILLALADFGPADLIGRTFHSAYRRTLDLKEIALLAAMPFTLVPLLGVDWAAFARAPEPNGWSAFGTSAILLALGSLFARRWRSSVFYVWLTVLAALLSSMAFAAFRAMFEPHELLVLAVASGPIQQPMAIPTEQLENYRSLVSWWNNTRLGFNLALILFLIYWLLRLARQEWTLASLAVLTFFAIGPYRALDTYITLHISKTGEITAQTEYTGQFVNLLNPIQLGSANSLLQVFLAGGLIYSWLAAAFLSLPLNPARYVTKMQPRRWTEQLEVKLLNYLYARPRLVRSGAIVAGLIFCLGYQQAVRLVYERWYWRPSSLVSYLVLLGAMLFFPRSVVILWKKRVH